MTTLDLIQSKLIHLDEPSLQQIYSFMEQLSTATSSKPGVLSQLRQIQINAPTDFAENLDHYLNQSHNASNSIS